MSAEAALEGTFELRLTCLVLLFLALSPPCCAAEAADGAQSGARPVVQESAEAPLPPGLHTHESVHFTLHADFIDEPYTQKLLGDMERYFSLLQKEFWDFIPRRHRESHMTAVLFTSAESFDAFGEADSGIPHGKMGYLSATTGRMAILRQDEYYKDLMISVHEMTHVFNSYCTPYTPVWLDEGMAQFYANHAGEYAGADNITDGVNIASLRVVDLTLRRGRLLRIRQMMQMDEEEFYGLQSQENFAQAWAFVYYLRRGLGPASDERFSRYYAVLARGGDQYRAFTGSYGINLDTLEETWIAYLTLLYEKATGEEREEPPLQPADAKADR